MAKAVDAVISEFNFADAEQAVRKALQTGKNRTLVTDAYWWLILQAQRRFDEALDLLAIAELSDPLSPLIQQGFGSIFLLKGDYQAARPRLETTLEMNPNDSFAAWLLSLTHVRLDQLDEAEVAIGHLEALTGTNAWTISTWAELYLARGDEPSARDMLARSIALFDAGSEEPALVPSVGMIYWYLGEVEEAINWFERGTETLNLANTAFVPIWVNRNTVNRNHPRLQALLKKMNLDDASVAAAKTAVANQ